MRHSRIILLVLFFSTKGFSQISDSLFRTYYNQDLRIRQLNFSGSLGGNNNNNNSDFFYGGSGQLNYSQFTNHKKLQSDFTSSVRLSHSKSRDTYDTDNPLDSRSLIQLNAYKRSRSYFKRKLFYGYGYGLNYFLNYDHDYDFTNSNRIEKDFGHFLTISIPLSIGIGRKNPVYSVHKSMWIYSELERNNTLKRVVNEEDVEQLAHLIDENVYTRYFDPRYKTIQDLSRVDSLLKSQNIIASSNITYFTTLYDMYYYSSGSNRSRGSILEGGLTWQYFYEYHSTRTIESNSENLNKNEFKSLIPILFAEYQFYNPINLHWQFDYGVRAEIGFKSITTNPNNQYSTIYKRRNLEGNAALHYYPNTRSYFTAGFSVRYGNYYSNTSQYSYFRYNYDYPTFYLLSNSVYNVFTNTESSPINSNEYNSWTTILDFQHYYYISPQFRIQSDFLIYYLDDKSPFVTKNKIKADFGVTFSYAFF